MKGVLFAKDEEELRQILSNQKYFLVSARKIPESTQFFTFLERVSPDVLAIFCREFAIMISAGITITKAIETLKTSTRNRKLREILEEVHIELLKGRMLSDSLEKYPKTFPVFFRNMIRIGEISGRLDKVLPELADYYENDTKVKKKGSLRDGLPHFHGNLKHRCRGRAFALRDTDFRGTLFFL
jgi:type IV pilus assembly protein PilC